MSFVQTRKRGPNRVTLAHRRTEHHLCRKAKDCHTLKRTGRPGSASTDLGEPIERVLAVDEESEREHFPDIPIEKTRTQAVRLGICTACWRAIHYPAKRSEGSEGSDETAK